jgi:hypothetical protein
MEQVRIDANRLATSACAGFTSLARPMGWPNGFQSVILDDCRQREESCQAKK